MLINNACRKELFAFSVGIRKAKFKTYDSPVSSVFS